MPYARMTLPEAVARKSEDPVKEDNSNRQLVLGVALVVTLFGGSVANAQIPEEFTNLQVLSEEIQQRQLVATMRGFASALGVRCNHCHVGEDPDSLEGYDFASDEKETKRTARVMMRMTQRINGTIKSEAEREDAIDVRCVTCHRGVAEPESLRRIVMRAIEEGGVDAGLTQYRELREEHYGGAAYDFSSSTLDGITEVLAMQKQDMPGAMAVNNANLEYYPEAPYTLYLHARLQAIGGDREGAIATLEKAIAANPDEAWLQGQLEELQKPPE